MPGFVLLVNQVLQIIFRTFIGNRQINHFEKGLLFILSNRINQFYLFQ